MAMQNEAYVAEAKVLNTTALYPKRDVAVEAIEELIVRFSCSGVPAGVCVTGCPGAGKTTIIEEIADKYLPREEPEKVVREVICVSVPSKLSGGVLYRKIIEALGGYVKRNAGLAELQKEAASMLDSCETKVIVLDEAQHLAIYCGKKSEVAEVADALKTLMNEGGVSIVLVGLADVTELLKANGQLRRRFSEEVRLQPWDPADDDDLLNMLTVIFRLVENGGMPKQEWFEDMDFLKTLCFASNGTIAHLAKLIARAVFFAKKSRRKTITRKDLQKSFVTQFWPDVPDERNPFLDKFNGIGLVLENEPFAVEGYV